MNLIEAIKSGKPFRRPAWGDKAWWKSNGSYLECVHIPGLVAWQGHEYGGMARDILADDWEIQEPIVAITRTQFWEEIAALYKKFPGESIIMRNHAAELARRLGLESP